MKDGWFGGLTTGSLAAFFALATGAFALCGCGSTPNNPHFAAMADRIETGGEYYMIFESAQRFAALEDCLAAVERAALDAEDPAAGDRLLKIAAALRLGWQLGGFDAMRGSAASSVQVADDGAPLYRGRTFYYFPDAEAAVPVRLLTPSEFNAVDELAELPADTLLALTARIEPAALSKNLAQTPHLKHAVDLFCRGYLNCDTDGLLRTLSGKLNFAVLNQHPSRENATDFRVRLPDRDRLIFTALQRLSRIVGKTQCTDNTIVFENKTRDFTPDIEYIDGGIVIYSSQAAKARFAASGPRVADRRNFQRMRSKLPVQSGSAAVFCGQPGNWTDSAPLFGLKIAVPLYSEGLVLLRRECDGLLQLDVSRNSFAREQIVGRLLIGAAGADRLYNYLRNQAAAAPKSRTPVPPRTPAENTHTPDISAPSAAVSAADDDATADLTCRETLRRAGGELAAFAAAHNGEFPAKYAVPGSHAYVYFPGWKTSDNPELPLLIDRPFNHPGRFYVLTISGEVRLISIEHLNSVKRAVGALHSRYGYSARDFSTLVRRAGEADRAAEKNNGDPQ